MLQITKTSYKITSHIVFLEKLEDTHASCSASVCMAAPMLKAVYGGKDLWKGCFEWKTERMMDGESLRWGWDWWADTCIQKWIRNSDISTSPTKWIRKFIVTMSWCISKKAICFQRRACLCRSRATKSMRSEYCCYCIAFCIQYPHSIRASSIVTP